MFRTAAITASLLLTVASCAALASESCVATSQAAGAMASVASITGKNVDPPFQGMPGLSATGPAPAFASLTEIHNFMKGVDDELRAMPPNVQRNFYKALAPIMLQAVPTPRSIFDTEFLHSLQFTGKQRGYAMDYNGLLETTDDGGLHWKPRRLAAPNRLGASNNPAPGVFHAMHFANDSFGAIVGFGAVRWTQDGGATWKEAAPPVASQQLNAVFCQAPRTCWAAGDETGVIYRSDDAFKTWKRQSTPAVGLVTALQFVGNSGWAVTQKGEILGATDGGETWTLLHRDEQASYRALHFVDARRGWVVGANGVIMHTPDGGKSWVPQKLPVPEGFQIERLRWEAVKFADERRGWTAGLYGSIIGTTDGGTCWTPQRSEGASHSFTVYALEITEGPVVWAAGNLGNIFVSIDGGGLWFPVHGPALEMMLIFRRGLDAKAANLSLCLQRPEIASKVAAAIASYATYLQKSGDRRKAAEVKRQLEILSAPVNKTEGAHPLGFSAAEVVNQFAQELKRGKNLAESEAMTKLAKLDADSNFACYFMQQLQGPN